MIITIIYVSSTLIISFHLVIISRHLSLSLSPLTYLLLFCCRFPKMETASLASPLCTSPAANYGNYHPLKSSMLKSPKRHKKLTSRCNIGSTFCIRNGFSSKEILSHAVMLFFSSAQFLTGIILLCL